MRDFEEDFDFDDSRFIGTRGCRIDSFPTVQGGKTEHSDNDERRARLVAHKERVQREMQELGISEGRFI